MNVLQELINIKDGVIKFITEPNNKQLVESIQIFALLFTAFEANRARKASEEANALKLLPLLVVEFSDPFSEEGERYILKNIGQSTAFDVKIGDWILLALDMKKEFKLKLSIPGKNYIEAGKSVELSAKIFENGKESRTTLISYLVSPGDSMEEGGKTRAKFFIYFKNALGKKYYSELITGKIGTSITKPARKLKFFEYVWIESLCWIKGIKARINANYHRWKSIKFQQ